VPNDEGTQESSARLYYEDSYLTRFKSQVTEVCETDSQWHVVLKETAFYPTSGGQPHDTGILANFPVSDVFVDESGRVVHVIDKTAEAQQTLPFSRDDVIWGEIDWDRRFHHMQHHTGQHILSRCFERQLDVDTIGFHLGSQDVTIDVDTPALSEETLRAIEAAANEVIFGNLAVTAQSVQLEDLPQFKLRQPPKVKENVRIVSIQDFDENPCGGTHVKSTAEVGLLKVIKVERMRKNLRIHFLCGKRAVEDYRQRFQILDYASRLLSCGASDLVETVAGLAQQTKDCRRREQQLLADVRVYRASQYAAQATVSGNYAYCLKVVPQNEMDNPSELKGLVVTTLQQLEQAHPNSCVAMAFVQGERLHLAVATSSASGHHAGELVQGVLQKFGGKGGGAMNFAQGSAPCDIQEIADAVLKLVEETVSGKDG